MTCKKNPTFPMKWKTVTLDDYAYIKGRIGWRGLKKSEYTETGPYLIANKHMKNNKILWDECDHISNYRYEESPEIQLKTDDIIISKDGTIGEVAIIEDLPDKSTINSTMMLVRSIDKGLFSHYLFYFFQSQDFKRYLKIQTAGSTIPHLFQRDMKRYSFPIPPLVEQRGIVEVLGTVDACIRLTDTVIERAEELKRGLMQQLLTRGIGHTEYKDSEVGFIPRNYEVVKLSDLAYVKRGASPRPITDPRYWAKNGRGWVRIKDVTSSYKYLKKTTQYLTEYGASKSVEVNPGDVIMSICATIGIPMIIDMEACIHDGFVTFRNLSDKIKSEFLYYLLQFKEQYFLSKRQVGTQGNINSTIVGKTKIGLPKIEEQNKIIRIINNVSNVISLEFSRKDYLTELKRGLMQSLLSGKIRVELKGDGIQRIGDSREANN